MIGTFQLRHLSKFGRIFRVRDRSFRFPSEDISRGIKCSFQLPDVAGHAIDHRSDVFFLRWIVAQGEDLLVGKIGHAALDLRNEPEAADHAGALDSFKLGRWLARRHECFAFRLPFTDELLQQSVFFNRPGHLLAGCILGEGFFCSSAHNFFVLNDGSCSFVQRDDERLAVHRTSRRDFYPRRELAIA